MNAQDILNKAIQVLGGSKSSPVAPVPDINVLNEQWKRDYVERNVAGETGARNRTTPQINKGLEYPSWMANSPSPAPIPNYQNVFNNLKQVKPQGDISNLVVKSAQENELDPALLASHLWTESGYNPKAFNNGDYGIAQINLASHPDVTEEQANDPNFAIPFAAKLLKSKIDEFGGDYNRGIAAYNVGSGGASIKGPMPYGGGPKGQEYLDKVARNLSVDLIKKLNLKTSYNK